MTEVGKRKFNETTFHLLPFILISFRAYVGRYLPIYIFVKIPSLHSGDKLVTT